MTGRRQARRVAVAGGAAVLLAGTMTLLIALPAAAGDTPSGFWYGTDSTTTSVSGHSVPYKEPVLGTWYGGYIGMAGNWANTTGCHKIVVWSGTNASQANANFASHVGVGTGAYWFMGGPGVDPHYNGSSGEAYAWGQRQAAQTLAALSHLHITYPVVFMDIEIPGHAPNYTPADDNGWNTVYTSPCSGRVKTFHIPAAVDRADINGYTAYLTSHSRYKAGVYSAPDIWASIFGTGSAASIPNTYEWTYESFTSSLSRHPSGWCLAGTRTCARFFGGQTSGSRYALMWQWSGGGGSNNGHGDFDQIDANRTP